MRRPLERARILRRTDDQPTLPARVKRILRKYGATLLMPGPSGILQYGFPPGNYRESTGGNLAAVDQQVGLVVDAVRVPGNNLVNPANWLAGSGTVISGGVATSTAVTAGVNVIQQDNIGVTGKMLEVTMTITVVSGGAVIRPGGVNGPTITATGTYTQRLQAGAADTFRVIAGASGFTGSITLSSISVRELPGIHASQSTSGFQPYLRQSGGVNSWQFDGVDDRLSLSAVPFLITDDFWAVCAYTNTNAAGDAKLLSLRSTTDVNPLIELAIEGRNPILQIRNNAGILSKISSPAVPVSTPAVVSAVKQASTANLRVDGVQNPSSINLSSIGALTLNGAAICSSGSVTPAFFLEGRMHGLAIGKGGITPTELLTLENFIARLQGRNL